MTHADSLKAALKVCQEREAASIYNDETEFWRRLAGSLRKAERILIPNDSPADAVRRYNAQPLL